MSTTMRHLRSTRNAPALFTAEQRAVCQMAQLAEQRARFAPERARAASRSSKRDSSHMADRSALPGEDTMSAIVCVVLVAWLSIGVVIGLAIRSVLR